MMNSLQNFQLCQDSKVYSPSPLPSPLGSWQCPTDMVAGHRGLSGEPPKMAEILAFSDCAPCGREAGTRSRLWPKTCCKTLFSWAFFVLRCPAKKIWDIASPEVEREKFRKGSSAQVTDSQACSVLLRSWAGLCGEPYYKRSAPPELVLPHDVAHQN